MNGESTGLLGCYIASTTCLNQGKLLLLVWCMKQTIFGASAPNVPNIKGQLTLHQGSYPACITCASTLQRCLGIVNSPSKGNELLLWDLPLSGSGSSLQSFLETLRSSLSLL